MIFFTNSKDHHVDAIGLNIDTEFANLFLCDLWLCFSYIRLPLYVGKS